MLHSTDRDKHGISRREFVRTAATIGGGLVLAIHLPAQNANSQDAKVIPIGPRSPSAFLKIAPDDTITIITPAVEMGQGGHTAMPMILMEELAGNWQHLKVQDAPPAAIYDNPMFHMQSTVGSFSVRGWYTELRRIGARNAGSSGSHELGRSGERMQCGEQRDYAPTHRPNSELWRRGHRGGAVADTRTAGFEE